MKSQFFEKISTTLRGDGVRSSMNKFKASAYAIIFGLMVGILPIIMTGGNVFLAYTTMISAPFREISIRRTVVLISVFILLGAGIGVSFKTGLFNIGAAGQFMLGGGITVIMGIHLDWGLYVSAPVLLIIAMIMGGLIAAISGALKAFFNVHEVVSTILLNWVLFYFIKWIFKSGSLKSVASENSLLVNSEMGFSIARNSNHYILIFFIVIVMVATLWFMFKYTTFGYRLKVNGLSETAANYSGINTKANTIISMAISGAFAGAAGFIYYNTIEKQMPALGTSLPTFGFEAITVTLLAFSSPIGAIPAGIFYTTLRAGITSAGIAGGITKETLELVLGLIVFFSALAMLFVNFKPTLYIYKQIWFRRNEETKLRLTTHKENKRKRHDLYMKELSSVEDIEGKKIRLKELHSQWALEKQGIIDSFKSGNIDVMSKDIKIKKINLKIKNMIFTENLEEVKNIKNNYKTFQEVGKRSLLFDLENMFSSREKTLVKKEVQ